MKKIILSIVGVLVVLWLGIFVTDARVLVKEVSPAEHFRLCREAKAKAENKEQGKKENGLMNPWEFQASYWCSVTDEWGCTYFNGRRLLARYFDSKYYASCPSIIFGAEK
jgi:hypothetical protein